jgi:hypothetical protein
MEPLALLIGPEEGALDREEVLDNVADAAERDSTAVSTWLSQAKGF